MSKKKRLVKASVQKSSQPDGKNNINTAYSNEPNRSPLDGNRKERQRGLQVYSMAQIMGATGRGEHGELLTWGLEQPYFFLTAMQRNEIFKLSSPVFGVVTSRMNRIAGLDFEVVPVKKQEDRMVDHLKNLRMIYQEYGDMMNVQHILVRARCAGLIKNEIADVLPDLSNFDRALLRWKKNIQNVQNGQGEEIKEWLMEPNNGMKWNSYIKKVVYNLMIHGCDGTYKQYSGDRLENFDSLPGGTVYRFKAPYFSGTDGYIQYVPGYEPQMFFAKELAYSEYLPTSCQNYSMVPLEALINKIAEGLLFDRLMAEQADGTTPPQKLVIVTSGGQQNPFGDFDNPDDQLPVEPAEQKRIQTSLNEPVKYGLKVMSGNKAELIDLTRENTMETQRLRQKDIREDVALVFNATNMEVNLSGSENTSGRETSESQSDIEMQKGIGPVIRIIEEMVGKDILPFRFGYGWKIKYGTEKNLREEADLNSVRLRNGEVTVNDLREKAGEPTFDREEFNYPQGSQMQPQQPGQDQANPMFTKSIP